MSVPKKNRPKTKLSGYNYEKLYKEREEYLTGALIRIEALEDLCSRTAELACTGEPLPQIVIQELKEAGDGEELTILQ